MVNGNTLVRPLSSLTSACQAPAKAAPSGGTGSPPSIQFSPETGRLTTASKMHGHPPANTSISVNVPGAPAYGQLDRAVGPPSSGRTVMMHVASSSCEPSSGYVAG